MNKSDIDIKLLHEDPERLLIKYQPVIRIIVRSLAYQGYLPRRDMADLVQEVNRKLLERFQKIRGQYNGKCKFKTYFSVVVRHLCLEEFRKLRIVAEPKEEMYEEASGESAADNLIIMQEFNRLQRALNLFTGERPALWAAFRFMADLPITADQLTGFEIDPGVEGREELAAELNSAVRIQKKEKMEVLSRVFSRLEKKSRAADAIRKWYSSRVEELVGLMNGNPPHSAYTAETLQILIEKSEMKENST